MQIKIKIMRKYHPLLTSMSIIKKKEKTTILNADKGVEQLELLYVAIRNVKW